MNYLEHLVQSKGLGHVGQRALAITRRYGLTPGEMMQAIERLVSTLEERGCRATFPVTAIVLSRQPHLLRQLEDRGIELAVHGWVHSELDRYSPERQRQHVSQALSTFGQHGIAARGFRSPYLRHSDSIRQVVGDLGFRYLSNQSILWDVSDALEMPPERLPAYERAISFYGPWSAADHQSLPAMDGQLIEIPVSLPDDEILVERLEANDMQIALAWSNVLSQAYARGELFTLLLHPERTDNCLSALGHLLSTALSYSPPVWVACLDEVATWWQQRRAVQLEITAEGDGQYAVCVRGPARASTLVRSATVLADAHAWADGYQLVRAQHFSMQCTTRPCVGVSERTSGALVEFMKQDGYAVEVSAEPGQYAAYLDRPTFDRQDGRALVAKIETQRSPLVRINRWPDGARSALAITGDIDALTLWDYGLRLLGS